MTPTDLAARYLAQQYPGGLHFTDGAFYPAAGGKLWPGDVHNDLWYLIERSGPGPADEMEGQHRLIRAAVRLLSKDHATPPRPMSGDALAAWLASFHRFVEVKNRHEVSRDLPLLNGGNWAEAYPVHHTERPRGMSFTPRHAAGEAVLRVRNYEPFAAGWSFCYRVIQPGAVTRAFWRGLAPDAPEPMPMGLDRPLEGAGGSWNQRLARWVPDRPEIPPADATRKGSSGLVRYRPTSAGVPAAPLPTPVSVRFPGRLAPIVHVMFRHLKSTQG